MTKLKSENLTALDYIASNLCMKGGTIFNLRWCLLPLSERKKYLDKASKLVEDFIKNEHKAECGRKGIEIPIECN